MRYVLRVGDRAVTPYGETSALPIEGARAVVNGDILRVLLAYAAPTDSECQAVTDGPVEIAVFSDGPAAALLLRIGRPGTPAFISVKAPVDLPARPEPSIDGHPILSAVQSTGAAPERTAAATSDPTASVELVLCDSDIHRVEAVRALTVPTYLVEVLHTTARRRLAAAPCADAVTRAALRTLRGATVDELMARAVTRYRTEVR